MKKIGAVLLLSVLIFGTLGVHVFGVEEYQIYFNGEEIQLPYPYLYRMPFVALAQKAGMETSFDPATGTVTSVGGGKTISYTLKDGQAEEIYLQKNGYTKAIVGYGSPIYVENGVSYISDRALEQVFDFVFKKDYTTKTVYIYDINYFCDYIKTLEPSFKKWMEQSLFPEKSTYTGVLSEETSGRSGDFGITLSADGKLDFTVSRNGEKFWIDAKLDLNGLLNLLDAQLKADGLGNEFDVDAPINFQIYTDGKIVGFRSDPALTSLVKEGLEFNGTESWEEEQAAVKAVADESRGKWISVENKNLLSGLLEIRDGTREELIRCLLRSMLENGDAVSMDSKRALVSKLAELFKKIITTEETDGTVRTRLQLNDADIKSLIPMKGQENDFTLLMEQMLFSVETKTEKKDEVESGEFDVLFELKGLPFMKHLKIIEGKANATLRYTKRNTSEITAPQEMISAQELLEQYYSRQTVGASETPTQ